MAKSKQKLRCSDIPCPHCRNTTSDTYAWIQGKVIELACGRCGYYYDAARHGASLTAGEVVSWQ